MRVPGHVVAVCAVLSLVVVPAGVRADSAAAGAQTTVYVVDSDLRVLMNAVLEQVPGTLVSGPEAGQRESIVHGCAVLPPARPGDALDMMEGEKYVSLVPGTDQWGAGGPLTADCRPDVVTVSQPAPPTAVVTWATPETTGVPDGVSLSPSGPVTITAGGSTVLSARDINGPVVIDTTGSVTITNSRIRGTADYGILVKRGSLVVRDTTIEGFDNSIAGDGYTAQRVEVTGATGDGFKVGSNVTIVDSWCHDLTPNPGAHADCAQIQSGVTNVTIRGNWMDPTHDDANAALFVSPDLGPSSAGPVVIDRNLLGGGNFSLFVVDGNYGEFFIDNIVVNGNTFAPNSRYGPITTNVPVTGAGNTMLGDGSAVPLN